MDPERKFQDEIEELSKEVHDRIGQAMVALKFMAETSINNPKKDEQTLTEMLTLIQQTQIDVRNLYNGLLLILEKSRKTPHKNVSKSNPGLLCNPDPKKTLSKHSGGLR